MATENQKKNTEVKAFARYIHVSPRKLRLVADMVRKTNVDQALEQLKFSSKNASIPLSKAINSAIANAIHNFNLSRENLYIKSLTIDGGPVYKRYAPRAQGRAFIERKRTRHINVVLESREQKSSKKRKSFFAPKSKTEPEELKKNAEQPESGSVSTKQTKAASAPKSDEKMKQQKISLKRRLFNRRSGQ